MLLSEELIEFINSVPNPNTTEKDIMIQWIWDWSMDWLRERVPIKNGIFNTINLKIYATQLNNILNCVKEKTDTDIYPYDPFKIELSLLTKLLYK